MVRKASGQGICQVQCRPRELLPGHNYRRQEIRHRFGTVTFCTEEKKSLEERAEEIAGRLLSSGLSDDLKTLLKEAVLTGYDLQKDDFDED